MGPTLRITALLALAASAVLTVRAEEPPRTPPTFSAAVDVVNVTVTVRDKAGRLVKDLKAEDFTLLEDGRKQQVQVFGRAFDPGQDETLALDLGMLFDTSESMLNELKLSQEAAARFLETVPRARDLVTVFFDEEIRVSRYDSENQQGLFDRIHSAKGGGNTALYDAVAVYLSRAQEGGGRKVLVLFTDGEDTMSEVSQAEAFDLLKRSAVTTYVVAFGQSPGGGIGRSFRGRSFLEQASQITGGQVYTPSSSRDLGKIYDKILDELAAQYVIGYAPDRPEGDAYRKLQVTVSRPELKVRHRPGYYLRRSED